jgi:hypothetical protein
MEMRERLQHLARLLREQEEDGRAAMVENAIASPEPELDAFVMSDALWGGAGSVADRAGIIGLCQRTEGRRKIERALMQLGDEQLRQGKVNPRTASWMKAFRDWEKSGF